MLMLRLLEALGYVCRWVVDWSDHVWVEAKVAGRWIHVDPCEVIGWMGGCIDTVLGVCAATVYG